MTNSAYIDVNMCLSLHRPPCCSLSCSIIITVDQSAKPNVLLFVVDSVEIVISAVVFNHGCCVLALQLPSCFLFLSVNCETVSVLC